VYVCFGQWNGSCDLCIKREEFGLQGEELGAGRGEREEERAEGACLAGLSSVAHNLDFVISTFSFQIYKQQQRQQA